MNRGINILHDEPFTQKHRILIVIPFPCHEANERVLAKSKLPAAGGRTVSNHLSCLHMVSLKHNRFLIVAVGLVAALKLVQLKLCLLAVIIRNADHF